VIPSFGLSITPLAADYRDIVAHALATDRAGLELIGIQDHPYQRRFLDTFALIGDLLARTSRVRIFPDVASLPMRPPPMIAKAAASLDVMSGGRFELGLGSGAFWDAVAGMGGAQRQLKQRRPALEEAIALIRAALDVGPERRVVRGPGPNYPLPGYPPGPPPAHRVQIWVGASHLRTLEVVGRLADGWIPGRGMSRRRDFPRLNALIDEAATAAGREPGDIRRIYNVTGTITDGQRGAGPLDGPVELWVETLTDWHVNLRADTFIVWPQVGGVEQVERLAAEVVPAVHAALGRP
jgi:alkanesulfonate monooxygenase SsuD/methylene tetrahydromethanopterin reductase-like flavin-dependent oxidoreductase (luciferase family)